MAKRSKKEEMAVKEGGAEKAGIRERLCNALDIVPDMLHGDGTVEIRGRNSVSVREGGRILLYTPERVTVALSRGAVSIVGRRLSCSTYMAGSVRIDGYVTAVLFEEE